MIDGIDPTRDAESDAHYDADEAEHDDVLESIAPLCSPHSEPPGSLQSYMTVAKTSKTTYASSRPSSPSIKQHLLYSPQGPWRKSEEGWE